ncbi:splicing factor-like protein 1 [Quercus suber]|uniref:Branchpoint-bridging protein n=1 Tax=Quercus suber TaxID=58331 RepID=A0AAW0JR18_QUESU
MRNHKFSQVSRNDIKENKTNQRLEEKAVLVSAGKCLPQSSSDRCYIANEPLEEDPEEERSEVEEDPEEKPSEVEEDPEEESVEEIGNKLEKEPRDDLEEDPEEDPIEELEEEPIKVLLEQIEEPSECTDPNNSYKKRSLDASTGESVVLQGYQSQKKCRQEESLKPESESSYAAPHFHSQSGLAMTLGDKCSSEQQEVHDNLGIRLNPRQVRLHQKLVQKHQRIISKLIKKNSTFKPPLEYKSSKLCKKIYIPVKEYPDYNFVGLIISPLGKTQKRMEKETGAKIRLRAVGMVEKLLNPIDDAMNEHKRVQLEELATLKANMCRICHEHGHHYFACPQRQSTFKMVCCDKCGSYKHPTETCGVIAMSPQSKSGQGSGSSLGSTTKTQDRPNKEIDNTNLYVNHLPENVDDNRLLEFFCPFGKITKARVIRNQTTRISKGYGFVKFENQIDAAAAMAHLNGCRMDGHTLAVRIAGVPPGSLFLSHLSPYQGPPPIFPNVTSQIAWPGWIPGSILPVPLTPVPISNGMNLHSSSIFVEHGNVLKSEGLGFTPASALSSLSDLPGCSSLHSSSNSSNQIQSSSGGLITQLPGDPDYPSSRFESYF